MPRAYRTYRSSGHGYECRTELTEVPGSGNTPGMVLYVPYRTQPFHKVPGTGMEFLQNSQKFRVRVWKSYITHRNSRQVYESCTRTRTRTWVLTRGHTRTPGIVPRAYRTYRSSGYGYACRTELTEGQVRVIPGKIPLAWFCTCPTDHNLVTSYIVY